ncbi:hypothetical protein ACIRCZ_18870 [Leifsonia sp. NPDC102414]|uniref:hypothetical protein n=1 Tax=Leifsonia sp. NPDC102414 TaxID=3364124 RepID=UPI00382735E7
MNKKISVTVAAAAVVVSASVGFIATQALADTAPSDPQPTHAPYKHNQAGESYGSDVGIRSLSEEPTLIAAIGVHGKHGYVRSNELNLPSPKSPEDAVRQMKNQSARSIDVYEADSKTVIDTFLIGAPDGASVVSK